MASKKRIVVVGNINMDIVVEADAVPGVGEYVYGSALRFIPGGNGLNQAVAATRLNGYVQLVGFVGDDGIGKELLWFLHDEDVGTDDIRALKGAHSGSVLFLMTGKVERHVVLPGSNLKAKVTDLPYLEFSPSDIVISQLTIPQELIAHVFERAKRAGARTMINLFPNYDVTERVMRLSDYIVLNEVELAFRTGEKEYAMAQHKDLQMDPGTVLRRVKKLRARRDQVVIATLADRGAIGVIGDRLTAVDGIKVRFADATGAGDCFLGAFATGLLEGRQFKSALEFANAAAALSVQKVGATTSFPRRSEVDAFLKRQGRAR